MQLALVTGTSRGIGLAVATALLERSWNVFGIARGDAPAVLGDHGNYSHARLDLSDSAGVDGWLSEHSPLRDAIRGCSRFALVNNAGVLAPMTLVERTGAAAIARALAINVAAPMAFSGFALREVPVGVPLRIVDLSSGAATSPYPGWGAYCASKAALDMAGRVLATEIGDRDAAVLSFAPGIVATEMQAEIRASDAADFPEVAKFEGLHEEGALIDPARPAAAIADWVAEDPERSFEARRFG